MDQRYATTCIVSCARRYFRLLGGVEGMTYHPGEVEWIAPVPPASGPRIIFHASLSSEAAAARIEAMRPGLRSGEIPSWWWLTPTSTPDNLGGLLVAHGFARNAPEGGESEPGMALWLADAPTWPEPPVGLSVEEVSSERDFAAWADVVNEALHGWRLVTVGQHCPLVTRGDLICYLARLNGEPVATSARVQVGDAGSVEFVSTLAAHRKQGAGTAVSVAALRGLRARGVRTATLRGSPMAKGLYAKLGFRPYFDVDILTYKGEPDG
jgi:hypothetical protein